MSKENEKEVEVEDIVETKDDDGNDTTDWKAIAQEKHEQAKKFQGENQGIAKRYKTKMDKLKESFKEDPEKDPEEKSKKLPSESEKKLDYGQKAFLISNGIKGPKETEFVNSELAKAGGELDALLENEYFQKRLEDFRAVEKTSDATPKGNRTKPAKNSVDYWLTQDFKDVPKEMKAEVVNAKMKKENGSGGFYNSD